MVDYLSALLVVLALSGYSFWAQRYVQGNFGFALALAVSAITVFIYGVGLVSDNLHPLIKAIYYIGLGSFALGCFYDLRRKRYYFNADCLIFVATLLLLYVRYRHSYFSYCDDFTHWGIAAKEIFFRDNLLAAGRESSISFVTYPPATAIFQYFISRNMGAYSEGNVLFAHSILVMLPIPVLTSLIQGKVRQAETFLLKLVVALLYLAFFVLILDIALQVENVLGVFYGILLVYSLQSASHNQSIGSQLRFLAPIALFMSLVKSTSVVYLLFFLVLYYCFAGSKGKWGKFLMVSLATLAAYKLAQYSWLHQIKGLYRPVWSDVSFASGIKMLLTFNESTKVITLNFLQNAGKFLISGAVRFSLLNLLLLCLLAPHSVTGNNLPRKLCHFFLFTFVAYGFSLLISYLTIFPVHEAVVSASHRRYLLPCATGFFIVTLACVMERSKLIKRKYLYIALVILMSAPITVFIKSTPYNSLSMGRNLGRNEIKQQAEFILARQPENLRTIFLEHKVEECIKMIYELAPFNRSQVFCINFGANEAPALEGFVKAAEYLYVPRPISYPLQDTGFRSMGEGLFKHDL